MTWHLEHVPCLVSWRITGPRGGAWTIEPSMAPSRTSGPSFLGKEDQQKAATGVGSVTALYSVRVTLSLRIIRNDDGFRLKTSYPACNSKTPSGATQTGWGLSLRAYEESDALSRTSLPTE